MTQTIPAIYSPIVNVKEMLAFDPMVPETYTKSRFINIVLNHLHHRYLNSAQMARQMGITTSFFSAMFKAESGISYLDFQRYYTAVKIHQVLLLTEQNVEEYKRSIIELNESVKKKYSDSNVRNKSKLKKVLSDVRASLKQNQMLTYDELAQAVGTISRAGMMRFVQSRRYREIAAELQLKMFTCSREHSE